MNNKGQEKKGLRAELLKSCWEVWPFLGKTGHFQLAAFGLSGSKRVKGILWAHDLLVKTTNYKLTTLSKPVAPVSPCPISNWQRPIHFEDYKP